eukprot:CAMPEP_0170596120 /NCGR_PEP_ID=MMETSP0224-20130122/14934_1 /TAXON_ID=285029 /ORGANISM="Togula jolla, Strain CCCM 725" /LENGTH=419 /DNA_ID=CAMNT_0010920363 /DNA_START=52 /DNA_END=1311 /DNA_ORIENTATION=+
MGYGTGVLKAYYAVSFSRGLTVGVAGASSLFISQQSGAPQNFLVAARGLGMILSPALFARCIGRMVWCGESQSGFAGALMMKVLAELVVARSNSVINLYLAFFVIGIAMAVLDTSAQVLVTRVHEENCGKAMMIYCAVYGIGCMLAPSLTIINPRMAWVAVAFTDFLVALLVARRRFFVGKPRNWKAKVRKVTPVSPSTSPPPAQPKSSAQDAGMESRLPARIVRAGVLFIFVAEATETAMSCWAFTYAVTALRLSEKVAALFPTAFYFSFTLTRLAVLPASTRVPPSSIVQVGTLAMLTGSSIFFGLSMLTGADSAPGPLAVKLLLGSLVLIGAGSCPLYPMMLASIRQHGDLSPEEQGWFMTSYSGGITMGMWLPGVVDLPGMELVGGVISFLIMTTHVRDFPWFRPVAKAEAMGDC